MVPCEGLGGAGKDKVNDMSLRSLLSDQLLCPASGHNQALLPLATTSSPKPIPNPIYSLTWRLRDVQFESFRHGRIIFMLVMLNKIHEAKSTMTGGILRSIIGPRQSHQYVHNLLMAWRPLPPIKGYSWSSKA